MKHIMPVSLAFAGIVLVLAGCSNASTLSGITPTVNIPAIKTNAAQEVIATLTADAPPIISSPSLPTPPDQSPLMVGTQTPPAEAPTPPYSAEAEEYGVYSAVIQTRYIDTGKPELIVINDQTGLDYFSGELSEHLKSVRQGLPELTDEVCADFEARNKQPQSLKSLLTISVKYVFINQQEIETTFKRQDGWDIFYAKYPNSQGHMHLSRVGFNPQMDMALVYVDNMSYVLAGGGYYVLLKRVNGKWTVQNQMAVWIS